MLKRPVTYGALIVFAIVAAMLVLITHKDSGSCGRSLGFFAQPAVACY